ncbi:hypothetical protein NP233_g4364 [Leucocoprinus birnbaumii]|uniref:NACHT domain-containing protein n=1 Tax=Leucocoprinus birnbaumii TaxID=56174 RepID=A0AAD5YVK5_9AGAR|nr:hypothetical protein NP233_g4364 [Leucocoprinus birnbaumii]
MLSTDITAQHFSNFTVGNLNQVEVNNPVYNSTSVSKNRVPDGIQILLRDSNPDAFYNSYARDPPPRCHPGTRREIVQGIEQWVIGASKQSEPAIWIYGPAGVGKSAVAQSAAELLAEKEVLDAAYFFSRPNYRDKARHLFPSIAFQLCTKYEEYRVILDQIIRNDPTLPSQALRTQFQELMVKPLEQARPRATKSRRYVVIIDGLDECESSDAQCRILEIIADAIGQGLPFRWIVLSRTEPHIEASFSGDMLRDFTIRTEIPVSRETDHEILCFLTDKFKEIGQVASLSSTWFSEDDIQTLVNLCAGLFIYAATIERFVRRSASFGPASQLRAVLSLARRVGSLQSHTAHPLHELDLFYTLIMEQVPREVLPTLQSILLLRSFASLPFDLESRHISAILGLDQPQFSHICGFLHSVLKLEGVPGNYPDLSFYHASFMDFMQDRTRSREASAYSNEVISNTRSRLLDRVKALLVPQAESSLDIPRQDAVWYGMEMIFYICQEVQHVEAPFVSQLSALKFNTLFETCPRYLSTGSRTLKPSVLWQEVGSSLRISAPL